MLNFAFRRIFLMLVVLAIGLTGCGKDDQQSKSNPGGDKGDKSIPADWVSLITNKMGGKVFEIKVPPTWKIDSVSGYHFKITGKIPSQVEVKIDIHANTLTTKYLTQHGWKPDGSGTELLDIVAMIDKESYGDVHHPQPDSMLLFGNKTMSYTFDGPKQFWDAKQKKSIPSKGGPIEKTYFTMTPDFTVINVSFAANVIGLDAPDVFREMSPMADRIISSIRLVDVSKMSTDEIARLIPRYYDSPTVVISRRRDYYKKMSMGMFLTPGWNAKVTTTRAANGSNEKGLFVIEMSMPFEVEEDQAVPRLIIVMEGLKVGPLGKNDFLNTLDPHIKSLLPEPKLLNTNEITFNGTFTLSRTKTRYGTSTRNTIVRTYTGHDAYDRSLKIRAYTAGGVTMACHVILVADSETFETILPEVDKALNHMIINFYPFR